MKKLSVLLSLFFIIVAGEFFLSSETKVSGQQDRGWKVWVKTSPCSGRFDWVSVAKENPAYGGGGGAWANADLILFGTGMHCVRNIDQSCTKAEATAEAAMVRASSKFSDYCCKEYSVWRNQQTGKMSVVVGKFGTLPPPWEFEDGPMCCEEAEALAGIPGACSGTPGVTRGGAGWQPTNNQASLQGETLTYYRGTTAEKCQLDCGANPGCKAFTFIRQGAYDPNDPPMCYLISKVTAAATSSCCISAIKEGVTGQIEGGGIMGGIHRPGNKEISKPGKKDSDDTETEEGINKPTSTPRQPAGERWILDSTTVTPETPDNRGASKWSYNAQSPSAHYELYNGDKADFQWTPPPQQIDSNGFTVSFTVQTKPAATSRMAQTMGVWVVGLSTNSRGDDLGAYAKGEVGEGKTAQQAVTFKPISGSSKLEVHISLAWGAVNFTYTYRRVE